MIRGLTGKWLLAVGFTMTTGLLLLGAASYQMIVGHFTNYVEKNLMDRTRSYASLLSSDFSAETLEQIRTVEERPGRRVVVFTKSGQAFGKPDRKDSILAAEIQKRLHTTQASEVKRIDLPDTGKTALMAVASFHAGGGDSGTVAVTMEMNWLSDLFRSLGSLILLAGVGALSIGGGMALLLSRRTVGPILEIRDVADRLAQGDYRARVQVRGNDELASLGKQMNQLADSLDYYRSSRQEFLSDVAHELRTPLSYVKGYSAWLQMRDPGEEKRRQLLTVIREQTGRLERLVEDLVTLSRLDEGKMEIEKKRISPTERASRVLEELESRASEVGVILRFDSSYDGIFCFDPVRFDQILINLLDNAIRHSESGGLVEVRLSPGLGGGIRIRVADQGVGMEPEELDRIWERFYRVEKSRARRYGGSGLGLSIVRRLVELHGGTIEVRSRSGDGTTFLMEFPKTDCDEEEEDGR
ncbi:phosphate regulon sensor histidine kinase protein PhoR [Desmospora sp. 8437]|nr:phosphate regulon sensor histidine kinase protein PhoR [Desmospora sp. 8437]